MLTLSLTKFNICIFAGCEPVVRGAHILTQRAATSEPEHGAATSMRVRSWRPNTDAIRWLSGWLPKSELT